MAKPTQPSIHLIEGIGGIILTGGTVAAGDTIEVALPSEPHQPLKPV